MGRRKSTGNTTKQQTSKEVISNSNIKLVGGFKPMKIKRNSGQFHYVYLKQHSNKNDDGNELLPNSRTLFISQLPIYYTDDELHELFSQLYEVETIRRSKPTSTTVNKLDFPGCDTLNLISGGYQRNVHIVFKEGVELSSVLDEVNELKELDKSSSKENNRGMGLFLKRYELQRPSHSTVSEYANEWVKNWERKVQEEKDRKDLSEREAKMEEDGFTIVERGGKHGRAAGEAGSQVAVASKNFRSRQDDDDEGNQRKKKKFNQPLDDFYRWQRREKKREGKYILSK